MHSLVFYLNSEKSFLCDGVGVKDARSRLGCQRRQEQREESAFSGTRKSRDEKHLWKSQLDPDAGGGGIQLVPSPRPRVQTQGHRQASPSLSLQKSIASMIPGGISIRSRSTKRDTECEQKIDAPCKPGSYEERRGLDSTELQKVDFQVITTGNKKIPENLNLQHIKNTHPNILCGKCGS